MEKDVKGLDPQSNVLAVEVKVSERVAYKGTPQEKKFFAFQIFNKKKGVYEELRFNKKVKNMPDEEGQFILEVDKTEINRMANTRKYPLTWISKINNVSVYTNNINDKNDEELPF